MSRVLVFVFLLLAEILVLQAMADKTESYPLNDKVHNNGDVARVTDEPVSGAAESAGSESEVAEGPEIRRLGGHHSSDKSVAGGGVIIGGLVTAIFAAVFCYIRVTRKRNADNH